MCLGDEATSIAQAFAAGGYDTAYIGKWHVDGHGRSNYIPPERRQGFEYWKVLECTHDYNNSFYYAGDSDEKLQWEGYDAIAQTRDAQDYLRNHDGENPFLLVLSWGPPHNPYQTAPEAYKARYKSEEIELRPNVPEADAETAREWLAGYYSHCTALDDCVGDLLQTLEETALDEDTIFLFFSDHGDMVGSHGMDNKQKPWDESIRVPFLLRYPARFDLQTWGLNFQRNIRNRNEEAFWAPLPRQFNLNRVSLAGQLEGNAAGLQVGQGLRILQVTAGSLHIPVPGLECLRVLLGRCAGILRAPKAGARDKLRCCRSAGARPRARRTRTRRGSSKRARPSPCATTIGNRLPSMPENNIDLLSMISTITSLDSNCSDRLLTNPGHTSAPGISSFSAASIWQPLHTPRAKVFLRAKNDAKRSRRLG